MEKAPSAILEIIQGQDIPITTTLLVEKYRLPENFEIALSNIIMFILVGALEADNVVQALQDLVQVESSTAVSLATDLEEGILRKANITLFKKVEGVEIEKEIATLQFEGKGTTAQLRQQILEKTRQDSGIAKDQSRPIPASTKEKKLVILKPGSRTQLLEQLQVLGTIPNDDEISVRLNHIQEQIGLLKKQEEDNSLQSKIALKSFMFGEKGKTIADASINKTTYSVPPSHYGVDPYREIDIEDRMVTSTHGGANA